MKDYWGGDKVVEVIGKRKGGWVMVEKGGGEGVSMVGIERSYLEVERRGC